MKTDGADIAIVIAAAGSGTRFGSPLPKQFCELQGLPVALHAVNRFRKQLPEAQIIAVVSRDRLDYWRELCLSHGVEPTAAVAGGETRWQSVKNAIGVIDSSRTIVLIHDGARPLVAPAVTSNVIAEIRTHGADGAIPAIAVTDSLRHLTPAGSRAVVRSEYLAVQTPQAFDLAKLRKAYTLPYTPSMTDDASVMEAAGFTNLTLVDGSEATLKITRPLDLKIAELYLG